MTASKKTTKRTKVALWLLIGPTALIIGSFVLFAVANWMLATAGLIGSNSLTVTTQILLYTFALIGMLTWLPGLIIGIVLLATPSAPTLKK